MKATALEQTIAVCETAEEEIRKSSNAFLALAGLQALSLFLGDFGSTAIAAVLAALALLLRFKQSRVAAVLIAGMSALFLGAFLLALPGIPWPEWLHALCLTAVLAISISGVSATFRYQRAIKYSVGAASLPVPPAAV